MAKAGRVALSGLSGATGGAGIGAAFGPVGAAIGGGIGGLAGLLGGAFGDDGSQDEEAIAKQREFLRRKQQLEDEQQSFSDNVYGAQAMQNSFAGVPGRPSPIRIDARLGTLPAQRGMARRGHQLESDQFEERVRQQQEQGEPGWQDWVGPLLGAGSVIAGQIKGDPLAARKGNLAGAADEADYIRSQPLSGSGLQTALDENDEKTRSALFGSRYRMSPYDF